jgi:hypothetical protein
MEEIIAVTIMLITVLFLAGSLGFILGWKQGIGERNGN